MDRFIFYPRIPGPNPANGSTDSKSVLFSRMQGTMGHCHASGNPVVSFLDSCLRRKDTQWIPACARMTHGAAHRGPGFLLAQEGHIVLLTLSRGGKRRILDSCLRRNDTSWVPACVGMTHGAAHRGPGFLLAQEGHIVAPRLASASPQPSSRRPGERENSPLHLAEVLPEHAETGFPLRSKGSICESNLRGQDRVPHATPLGAGCVATSGPQ